MYGLEKPVWRDADRLKAEHNALAQSLGALELFIEFDFRFDQIPTPDQVLLTEQRTAMRHYLDVLDRRVARGLQ